MPELKARLHADLNTAMKARDELTTATLRMALAAVTTEEVAGKSARELSDDEVMALVERLGFVVEKREAGLEAPYVQDPESMLRTVYRASHWVARKPFTETKEAER